MYPPHVATALRLTCTRTRLSALAQRARDGDGHADSTRHMGLQTQKLLACAGARAKQ
jgi:hypothetical protein